MTFSIFAGSTTELRWNPETKDFSPADQVPGGPVFAVRKMDFWQTQCLYDKGLTETERVRAILTNGLASVDGSAEVAAQFIASPAAAMVNPLVAKIVEIALGN